MIKVAMSLSEWIPTFWQRIARCSHGERCKRCCWEWQGTRNKNGYGFCYIPSKSREVARSSIAAHRIVVELSHGAQILGEFLCGVNVYGVPYISRRKTAKYCVLHICDNPPCCNPAHLRVGSYSDNIRDAMAKGRMGFQKRKIALARAFECSADELLGLSVNGLKDAPAHVRED